MNNIYLKQRKNTYEYKVTHSYSTTTYMYLPKQTPYNVKLFSLLLKLYID